MAVCQIPTCTNHGVHSCDTCGHLFCGKHGSLGSRESPGPATTSRTAWSKCHPCSKKEQELEREVDKKAIRFMLKLGGTCILIGGAILGLTALTDSGSSWPWYVLGSVISAVGLVTLILCAAG